ncbi:hypothetical protein [Thauera sp.]|uniref:hypothetical protein n=1 Tax=Thauera sp. TaxID=1905334 RepID=UPI0039E43856
MNKNQADAVARAILEPGIRAQEEARCKRCEQEAIEARRRQVSRFAVAGFGIGNALAYFHLGHPLTASIGIGSMGCLAGSMLGWLLVLWCGRSRAV